MSIVSVNGTLVYKLSTSKEAINNLSLFLLYGFSWGTKVAEFLTEYWLSANGMMTEEINLASLKQGLLYAAKIGLNWNLVPKSCL